MHIFEFVFSQAAGEEMATNLMTRADKKSRKNGAEEMTFFSSQIDVEDEPLVRQVAFCFLFQ